MRYQSFAYCWTFNVVSCKTFKLHVRLSETWHLILTPFKKNIRNQRKDFHNNYVNVSLACCKPLWTQFRYQTVGTFRTIRRLGERFNVIDVTNNSTRTERSRVTTRRFMASHWRDRPMPVVISTRNTPGTYNSSATGPCPFSETGMRCGE